MILAPTHVVGVVEHGATNPSTDAVSLLNSLWAFVEGTQRGVVWAHRANVELLLSRGSNCHGGRSGNFNNGTQFGFLAGKLALKLQIGLDRVGLVGKLAEFGGLIFRPFGHIGQFVHAGGYGGGAVLKTLEIACHDGLGSICASHRDDAPAASGCVLSPASAPQTVLLVLLSTKSIVKRYLFL